MKPQGYIKLHRAIEEWAWVDNPTMFYFWCRILLMANWEDKEWHGQIIERGSFITTLAKLSDTLHLSVQQVRTCLANMQSNKQITCTSTNKSTKITICKYDDYQGVQQAEQQTGNKQSNKPTTQTKEDYSSDSKESSNNQEERNIINNNNSSRTLAPAQAHEEESHPPTPFHFRAELIDLGVEPTTADAWLKVRKAKKAVNTEIAFKAVKREVSKAIEAGYTAEQCIYLAVEKSWSGFKFEWAQNDWAKTLPRQKSRIEQYAQVSQNLTGIINDLFADSDNGPTAGPSIPPDEQ